MTITTCDLHVNNIKRWTLHDGVKQQVNEIGFGFLVELHKKLSTLKGDLVLPLRIINALVESYNVQTGCFSFGNGENVVHVDFGLEDILYITGLPIDGMPVSRMIDKDSVQVMETHLALEKKCCGGLT
ncbi:hypothetical protein QL285_045769 [Trifolium repens]|nr:hypothetical protein QL285_045769 [Trifolium repens]